jgi:hypothetical protein
VAELDHTRRYGLRTAAEWSKNSFRVEVARVRAAVAGRRSVSATIVAPSPVRV